MALEFCSKVNISGDGVGQRWTDTTAPGLTFGLQSEVGGQLYNFGSNYVQLGCRNNAYVGGFVRVDLRDTYACELFSVRYLPAGSSSVSGVFKVSRTGDAVAIGSISGTTCVMSPKFIEGGTCLASKYLGISATATCATSAIDSKALCGCVPTCFLGATATATNATNATCLNGQLSTYYAVATHTHGLINNGGCVGTASGCILTTTTSGCVTTSTPSSLSVGCATNATNAVSATTAANARALCGCVPTCFLGATACAADSAKLGGHLPSYYLNTGSTIISNPQQSKFVVTQTAHGLSVGNVIKSSGANTYAKATADSASNAEVVGIVTVVTDVNTFTFVTHGIIETGVPVQTAGTVMFLSPTTAGALTATEPTTIGQISKPLVVVLESGGKALFQIFRGMEITADAAPIDSPVFVNRITTPIVYGGSSPTAVLTLNGTSSGTTTSSKIILQPTGGNVGIGTTAPTQTKLVVNSPNCVTDSFGNIYVSTTNAQGANIGGMVSLGGYYNATNQIVFGNIAARKENGTSGDPKGYLAFSTYGISLAERMRITSEGNVGIGTTAPDNPLHIVCNENIGTADQWRYPLKLELNDTTSGLWQGSGVGMKFHLKASDINADIAEIVAQSNSTGGQGQLIFRTGTNGTLANNMIITETGSVQLKSVAAKGTETAAAFFKSDGTIVSGTSAGSSKWTDTTSGIYYGQRVGIGTSSWDTREDNASPTAFSVFHPIEANGTTFGLGLYNTPRMVFGGVNTASKKINTAEIFVANESLTAGAESALMRLRTKPTGGVMSTALTIDSSQRVGIGEDNPYAAKLHINKDCVGGVGGDIFITNRATATIGNRARLGFDLSGFDDSTPTASIDGCLTITCGATDLVFNAYDGTGLLTNYERMRIIGSTGGVIISNLGVTDHSVMLGFNGWTGNPGPLAKINALFTNSGSHLKFLTSNDYSCGSNIEGMSLDFNGNLSVRSDITAGRLRNHNSLVLNTYGTVQPTSNVYLYSPPNDRDAWIYLDSADPGSNWGIYHRQIDTAVGDLPGNSIGFVGGGASAAKAYINLSNGNIWTASCFIGSGAGLTGTAGSLTAGCATNAGYASNSWGTNQLQAFTGADWTGGDHYLRAIRFNVWCTRLYMGYRGDQTLQNTVFVACADSASYAGSVTINYNNDSNSTYQMLWGSGNGVYGTAGVYVNPYYDYLYATDVIANSDCRLKKCIEPITNALSAVTRLQGVYYHLCSHPNEQKEIGFIAQDVVKIIPSIVVASEPTEEDKKFGITDSKLGIKYEKLTAMLVEAMKEQQKQIEELKQEVQYLKNKSI